MSKYRVKLQNGRVVGPFNKGQILELFQKGHIKGEEQFQTFPVGDWQNLNQHKDLYEVFQSFLKTDRITNNESTLSKQVKLAKSIKPESGTPDLPELDYENTEIDIEIDYDELERQYQEEQGTTAEEVVEAKSKVEKTKVINLKDVQNIEKTRVIRTEELVEEVESVEEVTPVVEEEPEEEIDLDEKTQFIKLPVADVKESKAQAEKFEMELIEKLEQEEREKNKEITKVEKKEVVEEETPKRKGMKPLVALAVALLLFYLSYPDEEEEKEIKPISAPIVFPIANEYQDGIKSTEALDKGINAYKKGTYLGKLQAAKYFNESLKHKFTGNKALGFLVLVYAEIYDNAENEKLAAKNIFRLLEITESKMFSDVNIAMGAAIFYSKIGKYFTSINIVENYLRLNSPTTRLFSIYLDSLLEAGQLDKAKHAYDRLSKLPLEEQNIDVILAIKKYLVVNEKYDEAIEYLESHATLYKENVEFLIAYSDILVHKGNIKKLKDVLMLVQALKAESSPKFYADFLEKMGILSAALKQHKKAALYFKLSLKLHEDDELRSKLAQLEIGGDKLSEFLIKESKVKDLIKRAKMAERQLKWDKAFGFAVQAADLDSTNIQAQLYLANIQVKRGYYSLAINTLEEIRKDFPLERTVNKSLFEAYVHAFKIADAKKLISSLSRTKYALYPEYLEMLGLYYERIGNLNLSIKSYTDALKKDPLNDGTYFESARIYLSVKNYPLAKARIQKAMLLDPREVRYRTLYARILAETEGPETAISYLLDLLDSHPDNPRLIGDIAYYYYQVQKFDDYNSYLKKLQNLTIKSPEFYRSMIKSAKLDGRTEDMISNTEELLKIEPGDLESRLEVAELYIMRGSYREAYIQLMYIKERLDTYPRVNYLLAKLHVETGKYKEAEEFAKKEIELNPTLEYGYYILGEAYRLMQDYKEARKYFEKAIAVNGKYVDALMGLGWIKMSQRYYEEARELYSRALKQDESNPSIHRQLGFIYRAVGQSKLAIESYETYLNLKPNASDRKEIEILMQQLR
ncbi:tetratricopeptide repeat protein [Bacteriovorax sp. BSW11_IV]|uniref:tetratricopeptide repeat protein n=1 Tax=Bacteriovorax sp. BSW11_IV TaxID=1353529 RepID=UPI00038A4412|nr:tetratricopeptide repeat protein [Bacteriovorax sp. BSW11_IV]EQC47948.1 tetratricopeptide repeat protein [Bacteriovorax sp. BSW11_IV]